MDNLPKVADALESVADLYESFQNGVGYDVVLIADDAEK